jgi:hypothetical protein
LLTAAPVQWASVALLHLCFWRMAGWKTYPAASWQLAATLWRFAGKLAACRYGLAISKNRFYFCAHRSSRHAAGAR